MQGKVIVHSQSVRMAVLVVLVAGLTTAASLAAAAAGTDSAADPADPAEPTATTGPDRPAGPVAAAVDTARATGSTVVLPVLGSTPDTGFLFGALALQFFSLDPDLPDARPSTFSPTFVYTSKRQVMVFLGLGLVGSDNRTELDIVPSYVYFPDSFFGIGRDVDVDTDEETYTSEAFATDVRFARRVRGDWRVGVDGRVLRHRLAEVEDGGQLAGGAYLGTAKSWLNILGPSVSLDSRDNTWAPRRGLWLQAIARFAGPALGSDYAMDELVLDLRGYRTVGADLVLAGQALLTRQAGDVPFFAMPRLGGDRGLRGYRGGLYRDKTAALARLELRREHLWGRLGGVVFAGIGDVAPDPAALTLAAQLWSAGGGLRFMLDEKERVNIRVDVGVGNGDGGFFLSLGEAF